jgi:HK97 family phage major capsid protein
MHPRRWASLMAAVDSNGRPLATSYGPVNTMTEPGSEQNPQGAVGSLQGLPVYVDPNLPINLGAGTNQDIILVLRTSEMYLYEEGAPRTRVFEDVGSGTQTVRISAWGYFASSRVAATPARSPSSPARA